MVFRAVLSLSLSRDLSTPQAIMPPPCVCLNDLGSAARHRGVVFCVERRCALKYTWRVPCAVRSSKKQYVYVSPEKKKKSRRTLSHI